MFKSSEDFIIYFETLVVIYQLLEIKNDFEVILLSPMIKLGHPVEYFDF